MSIRTYTPDDLTITRLQTGWFIQELNGNYWMKATPQARGIRLPIPTFHRIKGRLELTEKAGIKIWKIKP